MADDANRFTANDALMSGMDETTRDYDPEALFSQMRLDGSLIKKKARAIYEEVFLPEAVAVLVDPEASASMKLDYGKHVAEIADLKPKANQVAVGGGTSLQIVINAPAGFVPAPPPKRASMESAPIDVTPKVISTDPLLEPEDDFEDDTPKPLEVPGFDIMVRQK
jgi:hypothetical protein